jgi:hypothetical protein
MTAATQGLFQEASDDIGRLREPAGGAGLFDVDPDQRGVSQDPLVAVAGDAEALAEDLEL